MKKDIVLSGVGGQGILSVAVIIGQTAIKQGLNFRQSEVHGMSQRGGAVESHLRISDAEIYGDLIAKNTADILIALEPLEALRHIGFVAKNGVVITNTAPVKNIPGYPDTADIFQKLASTGIKTYKLDAETIAKKAGNARAQNVVLAGAAAQFLGLDAKMMESALSDMFAKKGQAVIDANLNAFRAGANSPEELK